MAVIEALTCKYSSRTDRNALRKVTEEIETLEAEFKDAQDRVQVYLDNTLDDSSSCSSQSDAGKMIDSDVRNSKQVLREQLVQDEQKTLLFQEPTRFEQQLQSTPYQISTTKESTKIETSNAIGNDLCRQLKRVSIPVFSGDKGDYENWKATFMACIDEVPASPEYKLLQLQQYLSGEALRTVEKLGHSALAYEAAKERLESRVHGDKLHCIWKSSKILKQFVLGMQEI